MIRQVRTIEVSKADPYAGFLTADEYKARLANAIETRRAGLRDEPVYSPLHGAAKLGTTLLGAYLEKGDRDAEKAQVSTLNSQIADYLSGKPLASTGASGPLQTGDGAAVAGNSTGDMGTYATAISGIESGGRYDAVGPTHPKLGRALGKYQVMEANVGPWTREALGRQLSGDEFLADKDAQEEVFAHRFGTYLERYGNPQDAASAWFTGRPAVEGAGARDSLGTTGAHYVAKFNRALGTDAPAPIASGGVQVASADPSFVPLPPPRPADIEPTTPEGRMQALTGGRAPAAAAAPAAPPQRQIDQRLMMALTYGNDAQKAFASKLIEQQMFKDKPTWGVVGEQDGVKQYGWIDPSRQTVTPYTVPGQQPRNLFLGNATEAQALNELVRTGRITREQAAEIAAGKVVDGPNGEKRFLRPSELLGIPAAPPPAAPQADAPSGSPQEQKPALGTKLTEGKPDVPNEGQGKAASFAKRMEEAESLLSGEGLEHQGTSAYGRGTDKLPEVFGARELVLPQDPKFKQFAQAERAFINSLLRRESGASIQDPEYLNYQREFMPQVNDPPAVIEQKRRARRNVIESMKNEAGTHYKPPEPKAKPTDGEIPVVKSPAEAARLPKGTRYRTPSGDVMEIR